MQSVVLYFIAAVSVLADGDSHSEDDTQEFIPSNAGGAKSLGNGFKIQAQYDKETDMVKWVAGQPDNSYLGFTLGKASMNEVNMLVFQANGPDSGAFSYYSKGEVEPIKQEEHKFTSSFETKEFEGAVEIVAQRQPQVEGVTQYQIKLDEEFELGYAIQSQTSSVGTEHDKTGKFRMTVFSDGSPSFKSAASGASGKYT